MHSPRRWKKEEGALNTSSSGLVSLARELLGVAASSRQSSELFGSAAENAAARLNELLCLPATGSGVRRLVPLLKRSSPSLARPCFKLATRASTGRPKSGI